MSGPVYRACGLCRSSTYAPLSEVLTQDEQTPSSPNLVEILNYVQMANHAFGWIQDGRPLTVGLLTDLQAVLVAGTPSGSRFPGQLGSDQVVIGRRPEAQPEELPVTAARFVPAPPGFDLEARMNDLVAWMARARPSFTARQVERELKISYARANSMIGQLVDLGLLAPVRKAAIYDRRFHAPAVMQVLLSS